MIWQGWKFYVKRYFYTKDWRFWQFAWEDRVRMENLLERKYESHIIKQYALRDATNDIWYYAPEAKAKHDVCTYISHGGWDNMKVANLFNWEAEI